jgi:hypothetical protein
MEGIRAVAEPIRPSNPQRPHICQQPENKLYFGEKWTCPECGLNWEVNADDNDVPYAYWDLQ